VEHYLAFDLGAESGRAILGTISEGRLTLEELHRFPNVPVRVVTGLYWDTFQLFREILQGLSIAGRERKLKLNGVGVDTWGVDFALLDHDGELLVSPRHYRDVRNEGMPEKIFQVVPREKIFAKTGIQFMQFNTLCQLYAMKLAGSKALEAASSLLFMPDLFNYWLTHRRCSEVTIASTSQFYNPVDKRWATELLDKLGLPAAMLAEIVPPGTQLGELLPYVCNAVRLNAPVYATASHDTASAVAAVPASGDGWCYISSGTWSLMGVELDKPLINEQSLALNFTNEIGLGKKVRFLKNISGLWLLQECRRAWAEEGHNYSYEELTQLAESARPFVAVIDPDAFLLQGQMPTRITAYCRASEQTVPENPGEICRVIMESLALRYRQVLESIEALLGRKLGVIHIVGGGSRNKLLNRFVAQATKRPVVVGPAEATAAGNILGQMIGAGSLKGLEEARSLIRQSFKLEIEDPKADPAWDNAYERFCTLQENH